MNYELVFEGSVTEFLCYISSHVTFLVLHVRDHVWST